MSNQSDTTELLNPHQAATLLGVHAASVKRWSDQGKLRCIRTTGGHRRFFRRDVEALRTPADTAHSDFIDRLWAVASAGEQINTEGVLLDYWGQMGRWEFVSDAIGTLLTAVGQAWVDGEMPVAEEHVGSETLLRSMARLLAMMPAPAEAPVCALSTVPNDIHTMGLVMSELVLAEHNWRSLWIGHDCSVGAMTEVMERPEITMLALSASKYSGSSANLHSLLSRLAPVARDTDTFLILGGTGAWPDATPYAHRTRSFRDFGLLLREQNGAQHHYRAV